MSLAFLLMLFVFILALALLVTACFAQAEYYWELGGIGSKLVSVCYGILSIVFFAYAFFYIEMPVIRKFINEGVFW